MRIMVTGGAGLIGIEVTRQLCEMGHEVHLLDLGEQIARCRDAIHPEAKTFYGSILDLSTLREAMVDCDLVIHLAAMLGVRRSESNKLRCIEVNVDGTKNVLDCAVQRGVKKVLFASSSEVYGEPLHNPIKESDITQGKTVYAVTKLTGEELIKAYGQAYPIDWTIVRYFNCYGPYQTAQFVISRFIKSASEGIPPEVYGDGQQIRSYTYVSDTARATILAALDSEANREVLNIGSGREPISLLDLAELVLKLAGRKDVKPRIHHGFQDADRTRKREIFERFCDSSKAMKMLDWKAEVSLKEGIKKVMQTGVIFDRWEHLYDEQT